MLKKASYKPFLVATGSLVLLFSGFASAQTDPHAGPVMNYHRIDDRLVTGGHLLDSGTETLKKQGVKIVIDLRDEPPAGERERYAEQGIDWINVPVEWRAPKKEDFDRFSEVMREHQDDHVLVQCQANYRASGMTYLYRVIVEKVPEDEAEVDLRAVWNPDDYDTWREYLAEILAQ